MFSLFGLFGCFKDWLGLNICLFGLFIVCSSLGGYGVSGWYVVMISWFVVCGLALFDLRWRWEFAVQLWLSLDCYFLLFLDCCLRLLDGG